MERGVARSSGVEIHYSVEGSGPETVLLVIGLGGRAADWGTAFPAALAEQYRVVRFDNRGVGHSPKVPGGYALSDLAGDAAAVLDAVGAPSAHVVGSSMGGMIAQLVALDHAERVRRLVLLATHFGGREVEPPHAEAMQLFDPAAFLERGRDPASMMRFTLSVITAPGFPERFPHVIEEMVEYVRRQPTPPIAFLAQLQAIIGSDRSGRVSSIRQPTLVVHGLQDRLIPPGNGRALAERIPGAELALLEGVGHLPQIETPGALAQRISAFLAR
jgi:pimeloyl-ACP methyl ester carboxylesterase